MPELPEAIYQRPDDYALEHVGDTEDIAFFVSLVTRWQPGRVLELACGNGRVTLPLAQAGAKHGFDVVGVELVPEMLQAAQQQREEAEPGIRERLCLVKGDMRHWQTEQPFDVILTPCSSVCHLLTLDDQIAAWRCAYQNLRPGGRFVVDVTMADLGSYADSFRSPPRELVEVDLDTFDASTRTRLIRSKTTRYLAHEQRARIRFLYDKYVGDAQPERSVSDFESHVYYPREMQMLFKLTGFVVESTYGDYRGQPLTSSSPQMIFCGVKPEEAQENSQNLTTTESADRECNYRGTLRKKEGGFLLLTLREIPEGETMINSHLAAYLNDHLAGSTMALQLLEHLQSAPIAAPRQGLIADLHAEVAADQEELETLIARLHITESLPRQAAAWIAEKAAQLKLRLDDSGGGSLRLLESLEMLAVGIDGKRALWGALAAAVEVCPDLEGTDYERLQQRALEQRRRVEEVRLESARAAFRGTS